jgi:hypothetical protein
MATGSPLTTVHGQTWVDQPDGAALAAPTHRHELPRALSDVNQRLPLPDVGDRLRRGGEGLKVVGLGSERRQVVGAEVAVQLLELG